MRSTYDAAWAAATKRLNAGSSISEPSLYTESIGNLRGG